MNLFISTRLIENISNRNIKKHIRQEVIVIKEIDPGDIMIQEIIIHLIAIIQNIAVVIMVAIMGTNIITIMTMGDTKGVTELITTGRDLASHTTQMMVIGIMIDWILSSDIAGMIKNP